MIDLHCHSSVSDGIFSPKELMEKARLSGINYIALTDHDTIDGIKDATDTALELGINLINGVELSCELISGELHIIGLFINIENKNLLELLAYLQKLRMDRNIRLVEKFKSIGIEFDTDELLMPGKKMENIGKPNFARALYKKGYVKHEKESYKIYLNNGGLADVGKQKIKDIKAIDAIHDSGGIAILAHPDQTGIFNYKDFTGFIGDLKSKGLDGMEVYYSNYNKKQIKFYKRVAANYDLLVSGGSDFHGPAGNSVMGHYGKKKKIPTELVIEMKNYLFKRAK